MELKKNSLKVSKIIQSEGDGNMDNKPIAKAIVGSVGALAVFGACAITGSVGGLWGLLLVVWMMDTV